MQFRWKFMAAMLVAVAAQCMQAPDASACSRIVYKGLDSLMIVGRSLDWKTPIPTNLYVYPAGMDKKSMDCDDAIRWVSRYGSVIAAGYDGGVTEGMNEKGLAVNGLFCKGTIYVNDSTSGFPPMSLAVFPSWLLDNCATTREAVELLRTQPFSISGATFDGGTVSTLHWGITDRSGESAILEFSQGVMNIYTGKDIVAMTNDPQWDDMQAIVRYWENVGGMNMLPGTVKSPDRCVRANFFVRNVESVGDAALGATIALSVMRNVSVPYHYTVDGEPNVSSTQWVSLSNLRDLRYYFIPVTNLGIWYVDLSRFNLKPGAPVMRLEVSECGSATGEVNAKFRKSEPFTPMW